MKRFFRAIAVILVLVMVASAFTGCLSWYLMTGEWPDYGHVSGEGALAIIFVPVIDVLFLPVALIVFIVRESIKAARNNRGRKYDGIDTFSATVKVLPEAEYNSLMKKFDALPESEIDALADKFYSLPESEIDIYSQTLKSFSEKQIAAMTAALNHLPEEKLVSLIETLNSMSENKLITTMKDLQNIKYHFRYERRAR